MLQAIQIETQSEQQSLTLLRAQRAARSTGRELALHRTEQALDRRSAPVEPLRKCSPHLGSHPMDRVVVALGGHGSGWGELAGLRVVYLGLVEDLQAEDASARNQHLAVVH